MQRGFRVLIGLLGTLSACQSDPKTTQPPAKTPVPGASARPAAAPPTGWAGQVDSLTARQLPALPRVAGQLLQARRWTDAAGENLLVVYRTEPVVRPSPDGDGGLDVASVQLYARQYVRAAGGGYQELWRLQDAVTDCPFDLGLGPLPGSTRITDLDHDGTTETTLVYSLACRSDVSPDFLKLIMREGKTKYALRGYTVAPVDSLPVARHLPANSCCLDTIGKAQLDAPDGYELLPGRYENENDFRRAPRAFLGFARAHWRRSIARDNSALL